MLKKAKSKSEQIEKRGDKVQNIIIITEILFHLH